MEPTQKYPTQSSPDKSNFDDFLSSLGIFEESEATTSHAIQEPSVSQNEGSQALPATETTEVATEQARQKEVSRGFVTALGGFALQAASLAANQVGLLGDTVSERGISAALTVGAVTLVGSGLRRISRNGRQSRSANDA
jgi:hypothetical protein